MKKHILVVAGSARKGGNTELLADAFIEGAVKSGHTTTKAHLGALHAAGCLGCRLCGSDGHCAQKDGMTDLYEAFLACDALVLVSPLYFGFLSAQMKAFIDRLYAISRPNGFCLPKKETALILCGGSTDSRAYAVALSYYHDVLVPELSSRDRGTLLVMGVANFGDMEKTDGLLRALRLGEAF